MPLIDGSQLEIPFILASGSQQLLYVDGNGISGSFVGNLSGTASYALNSSGGGGVLQFSSSAAFPATGSPTILYVDNSQKQSYYYTGSSYVQVGVFNNNIIVSGVTLGRYTSGQTIPAAGKTPEQVFNLISQTPIAPTVGLVSNTATILFNQTSSNNLITGSYTINSLGASVSSSNLQWRINGTGTYNSLSTSTTNPLNYLQALTLGNFNVTSSINYLYTVVDSAGASGSASVTVTPGAYNTPSTTLSANYTTISTGESNTSRDYGNITSSLSSTNVIRNSTYVNLASYQLQSNVSGGGYSNLSGASNSLPAAGGSPITTFIDSSSIATATSIQYRVGVTDAYTTTYFNTSTINFYWRNLMCASSTVVSSNATAQTVVSSGTVTSQLNTTKVWNTTATSANNTIGNYTYIIYPSAWGTLSNIIQNGALSVLSAFTNLGTYTVTNTYGAQVTVYVYKSNSDAAFANGTTLAIT